MIKLGILITTYNRPEYLTQCLDSLKKANLPQGTEVLIVDDASSSFETLDLINNLHLKNIEIKTILKGKNLSIKDSILQGSNKLFYDLKCTLVTNLDGDAIVSNNFIGTLLKKRSEFPDNIVTGFNCTTKNKNGSIRHKVLQEGIGYNTKASVGGINMMFDLEQYEKWIKPALEKCLSHGGNWDHNTCINSMKDNFSIVCTVPSVVQHIGVNSSMGHTSTGEPADVADDFKPINLDNVTLIGVDGYNIDRLIEVANKSCKDINFGAVKLLTHLPSEDSRVIQIEHIKSKEEYSKFMIKDLEKYVETDYVLTIQHDGYVLNAFAWDNDWFNYDYIGATWDWYRDGMTVGNGGFSLRSKKLINALGGDDHITDHHPEDDKICRKYRKYLEQNYNIKFATDTVASKFSIEGWSSKNQVWRGQFGYHGFHVKFSEPTKTTTFKRDSTPYIISQFQGLGDILWNMSLYRDWIEEGHKIIHPVISQYTNLNKHFPDITFIDKSLVPINYNSKVEYEVGGCRVIPLRWSDHIVKCPYKHVMMSKYMMYNKDWTRWRELTWVRDIESEDRLMRSVLRIRQGERYNLINTRFRTDNTGDIQINPQNGLRNILMQDITGYTLLDWGKVIENAENIFTVSTSIIYVLETLNCKAKEIHLYIRRPDEIDHSYYDYILTKKNNYVFH